LIVLSVISCSLAIGCQAGDPSLKPWPKQFYAQLYQHNGEKNLAVTDLWYDWINGRNFNIIQHQLGYLMHDVEWNNGTSYYFDLGAKTCKTILFEVGILRPDWLMQSQYVGVKELSGFTCNVWEKENFITYYEDRETQRPVGWFFRTTGMYNFIVSYFAYCFLSKVIVHA
jgi:hypothetical protein